MLTSSIKFENFVQKKKIIKLDKELKKILSEKSEIINSLKSTYKNSYSKKILSKAKKI